MKDENLKNWQLRVSPDIKNEMNEILKKLTVKVKSKWKNEKG